MKIKQWFLEAQNILEKQEFGHLEVHKAKIQLQLENPITNVIEIHEFNYKAKNAKDLKIQA